MVKGRAAVARVEGMEAVVVVARVAEEGVMAAAARLGWLREGRRRR